MPRVSTWTVWRDATIPADASVRSVAAATGSDNKSAGRWLERPRPEFVITLARVYGADPVQGLVAAGYLTDGEIARLGRAAALREATDLELAEEIYRRAAAGEAGPALTDELTARRLGRVTVDVVSDPHETLADAADDAPDWEREDEERERD